MSLSQALNQFAQNLGRYRLLLIVLRNTHDNLTVIFIADRTVCVYQTATSLPVSQWSRSQANCRAFLPYMIRTSTSTSCAIFSSS